MDGRKDAWMDRRKDGRKELEGREGQRREGNRASQNITFCNVSSLFQGCIIIIE